MAFNKDEYKRSKIIDKKNFKKIRIEKTIKDIIQRRYNHNEINTQSSYVYQKMDKLLYHLVYLPIGSATSGKGYVNIFDLHRRLESIIRVSHLKRRTQSIYTSEERQYMEEFLRSRKLVEERGIFVPC